MVEQGHDLNSYYVERGREAVLDLIPGDEEPEAEDVGEELHYDDGGVVIPF